MNELHVRLAEILEARDDEVESDTDLEEFAWDSLAVVSTIALVDELYEKSLNGEALAGCRLVSDIEKLISDTES